MESVPLESINTDVPSGLETPAKAASANGKSPRVRLTLPCRPLKLATLLAISEPVSVTLPVKPLIAQTLLGKSLPIRFTLPVLLLTVKTPLAALSNRTQLPGTFAGTAFRMNVC